MYYYVLSILTICLQEFLVRGSQLARLRYFSVFPSVCPCWWRYRKYCIGQTCCQCVSLILYTITCIQHLTSSRFTFINSIDRVSFSAYTFRMPAWKSGCADLRVIVSGICVDSRWSNSLCKAINLARSSKQTSPPPRRIRFRAQIPASSCRVHRQWQFAKRE